MSRLEHACLGVSTCCCNPQGTKPQYVTGSFGILICRACNSKACGCLQALVSLSDQRLSDCLSVRPSIRLSVHLSVCPSIRPSVT